ncbi:1,2-dihydroxy-3-keto-5-methylthiopentene dioxygenase [Pseudobacillus badius]|uniref:1,2-dihydroxy-3-keto-5-methylthiopentene dioxygenase n=1 Tax=Bacillus badius TaxID=1455 RepID=UPI0007B0652F|nr:cupin domain-containing protein [Bacillus badius]KZO01022.1 acireductone dioxygenase [Bacillus badius]MED0665185.1 cupin domain-containing protein [Bacillus badius]OCS89058.1 acireductone dioxygenase [Bacillus badius]OVE48221.1 acireductone dioxygenase [Bacillus badius]TDW00530.1 acireductone dioxygenase apoprotein [Bacillus badius]
MTTIKIQETNEIIDNQEEVVSFLQQQDVIYEHWDISKLPVHLQEKYVLSDEEKKEILTAFEAEIKDIAERRGYQAWDVISLADHTPNLEELLTNFQREHHHTDDEVRFIASGHGVFVIQGKDGRFFEVHLNPGDLISVPESVRHYFTLSDDRKVVAVRIFVTEEGWVPVY